MSILNTLAGFFGGDKGIVTLKCNGETLSFPVDPSEFHCSVSNKNTTVDIISAGEYNMIGKTGLKSISVASFFPAQKYQFLNYSASTKPYSNVELIESWRQSGYPCHIVVSNSPISFDCLIESFEYGENDGTKDVYFTLSLKEYRYPQTLNKGADELTGLLGRKPSYLERAGYEFGKRVLSGESPKEAVTGAIRAGGLTDEQDGYLKMYENVCRGGGLTPGDVLTITNGSLYKNGKKVPSAVFNGIPVSLTMS